MSNQSNSTYSFPKLLGRWTYHGWEILEYDVRGKTHFEASNGDNSIILKTYDEVIEMIDSHSDNLKQAA